VTDLGGLEGPGARVPMGRRVWRARPNIEPAGLDINGTRKKPLNSGSGRWGDAMETCLKGWRGWEPVCPSVGGFDARDRLSSPAGSISVEPARNRLIVVGGGGEMR
jgi:hypothetical protein